jgi:hypothetical protein
MMFMKKSMLILLALLTLGCSTKGDVYSGKKGEEFDVGKTIGLAIGAALLYEAARSGGGGGGGGSSGVTYIGTSLDDDDWELVQEVVDDIREEIETPFDNYDLEKWDGNN